MATPHSMQGEAPASARCTHTPGISVSLWPGIRIGCGGGEGVERDGEVGLVQGGGGDGKRVGEK